MKLPFVLTLSLALLSPLVSAQEIKLLASDGVPDDSFGVSCALSDTTAVVGAYEGDGNFADSGAAYLFDTATGAELAKLTASDGEFNDYFGQSVAISGDKVLVGASLDDDNGFSSGSAYLFDATTGAQLAKLTASDGAGGDWFGWSVDISGTTAIIGAPHDNNTFTNCGSAYLFDITTGAEIGKLSASDRAPEDKFGISVAISGNIAIIGAFGDDDNGNSSGSAYLFDITTGAEIAKLLSSDGAAGDNFGRVVAISGTTALVGVYDDDDNGPESGSAYLFDTTTGLEIAKLLASDGESVDRFGFSVAISGTTAIVGAYRDGDNGSQSGAVYLFDTTTGAELVKITASDGVSGDNFGSTVDLLGTTALVGAVNDDDNGNASGSAYLIDVCAGHVASYCVASPNSVSATGAPISLDGLPSVSSNSMTLRADSLPPNQACLFFCGPIKQDPPVSFGDGLRCVRTSGLSRLNPPLMTGSGTAQRALDLTSGPLSNTQVGDTQHFQLWYRDPALGGANYNLTDALEVTFCP